MMQLLRQDYLHQKHRQLKKFVLAFFFFRNTVDKLDFGRDREAFGGE